MNQFEIISVNISDTKGVPKVPAGTIELRDNYGVVGDAHAGVENRQVSLLALEEIETMQKKNDSIKIGDFAENITTKGVVLHELPIGTRITINGCILEVTQIGKTCHSGCAIFQKVGDCIMPKRGIFVKVIQGGNIQNGNLATYNI